MLSWFRSQAQDRRTALDLYGATVAQARNPAIFAASGIEDTAEGRTSVIILHLFLVLDRLNGAGPEAARLARFVSETFVADIDDCLREMGVGDLSVPKKVKRAAQALGERCVGYRRAIAAGPDSGELVRELVATIPGLDRAPDAATGLARYVESAQSHLLALTDAALLAGRVSFPAIGA